jgi:hypothetical protein
MTGRAVSSSSVMLPRVSKVQTPAAVALCVSSLLAPFFSSCRSDLGSRRLPPPILTTAQTKAATTTTTTTTAQGWGSRSSRQQELSAGWSSGMSGRKLIESRRAAVPPPPRDPCRARASLRTHPAFWARWLPRKEEMPLQSTRMKVVAELRLHMASNNSSPFRRSAGIGRGNKVMIRPDQMEGREGREGGQGAAEIQGQRAPMGAQSGQRVP